MVKKNTIPDGWRNVSPVGQPIPGTRFIAFKVPLKGVINHRLTPTQKFTPKDLIAAVKAFNMELGLIIDLTYTTRYYDIKDLPKSMEYKKLFTVGLEVPDDPTILQFKKWVRKFLWENADNEKLIGVHCTNGINRTGYLICRYLIDVEGWDPETAIQACPFFTESSFHITNVLATCLAFGEARGHHMDGHIYLTDLKTQPMRSNLGMNMWDADGDIMPPPNDIDGHIDRFSNEEYSRPSKRPRDYDDSLNDFPEHIRLREFDFINKGPGQRRRPYHDHHFHDDIQPLPQMRQRHFADHQFHDEYQEEMQIKDLKFSTRGSRHRFQSFQDHQLDNDFPGNVSGGDINMDCSQRHKHFADTPCYNYRSTDNQLSGGRGQRRRPFYNRQASDDFQLPLQVKNQLFLNKRPMERLRLFKNCPVHDDVQPPMEDFEYVARECGQRIVPFLDQQHYSELRRKLSLEHFDDEDSNGRSRPFHDNQSYCDFNEKSQMQDFQNGGPKQRLNSFNDHSTHTNESYEEYSERSHRFPSHEYYAESPLLQRDYGSDKDNYSRTCRSDCLDDYRKIHPSDVINREGKARFGPYSSYATLHSSSSHQELSSVSLHSGREHQREIKREMSQGKKLPVVTIDYNYGLPLDYASEEEDRAHYDSRTTEHYILK